MTRTITIVESVGRLFGWLAVIIVSLLAFPMIYDVAMRTAGHPTIWAYELTVYALVTATFLANADALREGRHFRVTALLKGSRRRVLFFDRVANGATLAFGLILVAAGCEFVHMAYVRDQHSATLLFVPLYYPRAAVPLGALGLTAQALANLMKSEPSLVREAPVVLPPEGAA